MRRVIMIGFACFSTIVWFSAASRVYAQRGGHGGHHGRGMQSDAGSGSRSLPHRGMSSESASRSYRRSESETIHRHGTHRDGERGAASDHYGSRRGLPYHSDRNGLGIYLSVPFGAAYAPYRAYDNRYLPYGAGLYGSPYGYYSSSYYGVVPYAVTPAELGALNDTQLPVVPLENPYVARPTQAPLIECEPAAAAYQLEAEAAFREHRFEDAARFANHAMVEDRNNGKLCLFAAQTQFALGDYDEAAQLIHLAASLLPASEWGFVVENYKLFYRGRDFVQQMESLVQTVKANPQSIAATFVRGYQYRYLGYHDSARALLAKVVQLAPDDRLAAELLTQIPAPAPAADAVPAPSEPIETEVSPATEILPAPTLPLEAARPDGPRTVTSTGLETARPSAPTPGAAPHSIP
jgi:tetratricopeptide (TPR) repeat protein